MLLKVTPLRFCVVVNQKESWRGVAVDGFLNDACRADAVDHVQATPQDQRTSADDSPLRSPHETSPKPSGVSKEWMDVNSRRGGGKDENGRPYSRP